MDRVVQTEMDFQSLTVGTAAISCIRADCRWSGHDGTVIHCTRQSNTLNTANRWRYGAALQRNGGKSGDCHIGWCNRRRGGQSSKLARKPISAYGRRDSSPTPRKEWRICRVRGNRKWRSGERSLPQAEISAPLTDEVGVGCATGGKSSGFSGCRERRCQK